MLHRIDNSEILLRKAKLAIRRGNYRKAEGLLKRVIHLKTSPRVVGRAWFNLAAIMAALEEFQVAIEFCDKSLKFNKYFYETHLLKGICQRRLGQSDVALDSLDEALNNRGAPEVLFQKSITLAKLGRQAEAESYFKELLGLPENFFKKSYEKSHETLENSIVQSGNVLFLGVEHGCAGCMENIQALFETNRFDGVALELDFVRLFSFLESSTNILDKPNLSGSLLSKFRSFDFSASDIWADQFYEMSLMAWYAYGTFPGQEMIEAMRLSEVNAIPYFLLDQNIHDTKNSVKNLETDWNQVIIKMRDLKMLSKLSRIQGKLGSGAKILCVVGRAHLYGIYSRYEKLRDLKSHANAPPVLLWSG